ncbi:MAG: hypothetical protein ACRCSN_08310 [Dermatophilaceae bacterium]
MVDDKVVAALTKLYEMCAEAFRKSEEKVAKLCDDVEAAINGYEVTDDRASQDVNDSVDDGLDCDPLDDRTTTDSSSTDSDEGGSESDDDDGESDEDSEYRQEADEARDDSGGDDDESSEEANDRDADERRDELAGQGETVTADGETGPADGTVEATTSGTAGGVTAATAKGAQDQAAGIAPKLEALEDFDVDYKAQVQAGSGHDDPMTLPNLEADKNALLERGSALATKISDHTLATATYTEAQLQQIVEEAKTYQSDYDNFMAKHDNLVAMYDYDDDKADSTSNSDDSGSVA